MQSEEEMKGLQVPKAFRQKVRSRLIFYRIQTHLFYFLKVFLILLCPSPAMRRGVFVTVKP